MEKIYFEWNEWYSLTYRTYTNNVIVSIHQFPNAGSLFTPMRLVDPYLPFPASMGQISLSAYTRPTSPILPLLYTYTV